jgi:1-deoxy-D-xylulose-5-phosphate synthase
LTIMAPSDEDELADMLATAFTLSGPSAIRYPRSKGSGVAMKKDPAPLPVGKARMLREGQDLLIIAVGSMVKPSLDAAEALEREGKSVAVMDARFIKPLDRNLIVDRAAAIGKVLIVEEGVIAGGFGSAVLELLSEEGLYNVKTARAGIHDGFVEHGARAELLADLGLDSAGIAQRARDLLEERISNLRRISEKRTRVAPN